MAKNKNDGFEIVADGFVDAHTASFTDDEKVEWFTAAENAIVKGKLSRAFVFKNDEGKKQVAYGFVDEEGTTLLVGERAAYKQAFRELNMGDEVILVFKSQIAIPGKKNQSMWEVNLKVKRNGGSVPVMAVLDRSNAELNNQRDF